MFITYKTTCLETGKYYIGSHKTDNLEDDYLGSGKKLNESIQKYGVDQHKREILGIFETRAESLSLEHNLIKHAVQLNDDKLLNMNDGGYSFDAVNATGLNLYEITPENLSIRLINLEKGRNAFKDKLKGEAFATEYSKKQSESKKIYYLTHENAFKGKHHSEETIEIISAKAKVTSKGERNSQYGTFWITNGTDNLKWSKDKGSFPVGYYKGRVIKK